MIKIPVISIKPYGITLYEQYLTSRPRNEDELPRPYRWRPSHNQPSGIISPRAARRIESALKWLLFFSRSQKVYDRENRRFIKFRLCFVTITLSSTQRHSDQVIKSRLFNQLLTELREQNNMQHYIWRAEKQENGNIHFHLVTNVFLNAAKLRQKWNRIQNKSGYVDAYAARMHAQVHNFADYYRLFSSQGTPAQLRRRFIQGQATAWHNPNSTDIHSVRHVNDRTRYLCKYLCKNLLSEYKSYEEIPPHLLVSGKLWGLSQSLSALKKITTEVDSFISNDLEKLFTVFADRVMVADYCVFIPVRLPDIVRLGCTSILRCIFERLKEIGIYSLTF